MARGYLPKLTIAILMLSIALVLLSAQPSTVAAAQSSPQTSYPLTYGTPHPSLPPPTYTATPPTYNPTPPTWSSGCSYYYQYYCNYSYYSGYPYYYSSYGYPYSSYGYPYSSYGYPYSSYGYPYSSYGYPYSAPSSYTLTVATNPSNLGTVTGSGTFTSGSSASFSVTSEHHSGVTEYAVRVFTLVGRLFGS